MAADYWHLVTVRPRPTPIRTITQRTYKAGFSEVRGAAFVMTHVIETGSDYRGPTHRPADWLIIPLDSVELISVDLVERDPRPAARPYHAYNASDPEVDACDECGLERGQHP